MRIYAYICVYMRIYVYMYRCMYIYIYICMYVCMYVRMYVCMYVCMYIYACTYFHSFVQFQTHMYLVVHSGPYCKPSSRAFRRPRWWEATSRSSSCWSLGASGEMV